jgi:hypothetical protein
MPQKVNPRTNPYVSKPTWFDFHRDLRADILGRAHPPRREHFDQTVSHLGRPGEWPYVVDFRFTRARKLLTKTDLLQISITQTTAIDGVDTQTYVCTWHNIRSIRLRSDERRAVYTLEFIGRDADGHETTFRPPDWVTLNYTVFHARAYHALQRLHLTLHETCNPSVLEFSVEP